MSRHVRVFSSRDEFLVLISTYTSMFNLTKSNTKHRHEIEIKLTLQMHGEIFNFKSLLNYI